MRAGRITLDASAKDFFFDRARVLRQMHVRNVRRLSKAGAYVRRRARTQTLRRRKAVSAPGSPPSVHSSDSYATLKNILFATDANYETVIIGPVKLNQAEFSPGGRTTVPERLEKGGVGILRQERFFNTTKWFRRDLRRNRSGIMEYRTIRATYKKRPFMGPTLQAEAASGSLIGLFGAD